MSKKQEKRPFMQSRGAGEVVTWDMQVQSQEVNASLKGQKCDEADLWAQSKILIVGTEASHVDRVQGSRSLAQ